MSAPRPAPPDGGAPRPSAAPELRRLLLRMALATLALHAAAIGLHAWLGIAQRPPNVQKGFTAAWMVAALLVVLPFMLRMRAVRARARHARIRQRP